MTSELTVLRPNEGPWVDPGRIADLYVELGSCEAEKLLARAMSEVAVLLAEMMDQYQEGLLDAFRRSLRAFRRISFHVGIAGLVVAADAVADCLEQGNATALAATWTRLLWMSEKALACDWALDGLSG